MLETQVRTPPWAWALDDDNKDYECPSPPTKRKPESSPPRKQRRSSPEPEAQWKYLKSPSVRMTEKIRDFEASVDHSDPEQRGFILAEEQKAMCQWFGAALDVAVDEETNAMPMNRRTQKACLLIGGGGTGKTTIVLKFLLEVFVEYFPPQNGQDRFVVTTFSHAQSAAISNDKFRATTAHGAVCYRVASLRNEHMGLKTRHSEMETKWVPKILLVEDEASLFPAMVQNMLLYRIMLARQKVYELLPEEYAEVTKLFGHMPILIVAGDFLQIKPVNDISIADDMVAMAAAGRKIHPEHTNARDAILEIPDVINLKKSKRFLDESMPALMQAIRASRPEDPLSDAELEKLRGRKIEVCASELDTPLFAEGHVLSMYWENVARSISERAHRDAQKLNVPLYCLQAADQRPKFNNRAHEIVVTHTLLTVPNIHRTGKLHGMLLLHESMVVRLSAVLAPQCGIVKDKLARVIRVVLHPSDQRRLDSLPHSYSLFVPEYMARGVWIQLLSYKESPIASHLSSHCGVPVDKAESLIFIELCSAEFKCDVHIGDEVVPVHAFRWQFPLTHAMVRTAYSCQGLTLEGGVLVDLRRAGGLQDDDWFLAIYVMLSRARRLKNLILLGFTEQVEELLRRGSPTKLMEITASLEARAEATFARLVI